MNKKLISLNLAIVILLCVFSVFSSAVGGEIVYTITIDENTFLSSDTMSGDGWSYSENVLTLDNYSGSTIKASGDLAVYAKNDVTISGTPCENYDAASCGFVVTGTLNLNVEGNLNVSGADNSGGKGGEAIVAANAIITSERGATLNVSGGSGSVAIKANTLEIEASEAEIRGGADASAIYFSSKFTVKGATNAVIISGSDSKYAITYLNGATYSFDEEEQTVEFYNNSSKVVIVAKNDFIPGDCNSDQVIDTKDAVLLAQYLAKWTVTIDERAADCRFDGFVDTKDAVLLAQYLAKWTVTLG